MTLTYRRCNQHQFKIYFRNVYIKQFGVLRQKLDVLLGVGMAVLVVVSKILGTFCDFMIALANMKGTFEIIFTENNFEGHLRSNIIRPK